MASVKELLKKSLKDLDEHDLKKFQCHLEKDHDGISKCDMENENMLKIVNKIMDHFGPEEAVKITVQILRKINQNNLAEDLEKKHKQDPDPKTRDDFLKFSHKTTLDMNTAHKNLCLSEGNRMITNSLTAQPYPALPERFDFYPQVLCSESACGRSYWDIEWGGESVYIAVSYQSISRKGPGHECGFGYNDQSWSLECIPSSYSFRHNNIETALTVKPISRRVGVYVDLSAGTLSFYSVSGDSMSLIHTVQTTFTQPLYPGFGLWANSSVRLC